MDLKERCQGRPVQEGSGGRGLDEVRLRPTAADGGFPLPSAEAIGRQVRLHRLGPAVAVLADPQREAGLAQRVVGRIEITGFKTARRRGGGAESCEDRLAALCVDGELQLDFALVASHPEKTPHRPPSVAITTQARAVRRGERGRLATCRPPP